jgi:capsular polysaccharide biosynthesis protein
MRSPYNETEIVAYLKSQGFEVHTMDGKTIEEQVLLFNSASVIITPHGAALANLVFCDAGTKVLEFFSERFFSLSYIHISSLMNLDHSHIICDVGETKKPAQANFYVNLDDIKMFVENNLAII